MKNKVVKNTSMLYLMSITKMILPLITLPYLTRVLSVSCYGSVTYVKAVMQYMQLFVDFGFVLSGTKAIAYAKAEEINEEISKIFWGKILLSLIGMVIVAGLIVSLPILRINILYVILSYMVVVLTCFLFDYYFRGIEEMQVITIRFFVMRGISTVLTFVFVKDDADILWIPILDLLGTIAAIILVFYELRKRKVTIIKVKLKSVFNSIKESLVYFLSNIATTAFLALNTILIGMFLTKGDVAYWGICLQMVSAVLSLYSPITDGIFPYMVKNKDFVLIRKTLKIFMPFIVIGCIFTYFVADYALLVVGGKEYVIAAPILRALIPVLLFGFPATIFGWPVLGAMGKEKENTVVTMVVAMIQIFGLGVMIAVHSFNLMNIALYRSVTECILFIMRFWIFYINKNKLKGKENG